jgi:hypothetical protein
MHLRLFIDHTYMAIFRVYSIKQYNKTFVWRNIPISVFINCYKILKLLT